MIGDLIDDVLKHALADAFGEALKPIIRGIGQVVIEGLTFGRIRVAPAPKKKRLFERRSDHLEIHTGFADVLGTVIFVAAALGLIILIIQAIPVPGRQNVSIKPVP